MEVQHRHEVFFEYYNKTVHVENGTLLADACSKAGYPLDLVCGGKGTCGKCKVLIEREKKEFVLACRTKIEQDITVYLAPRENAKGARILSTNTEKITIEPSISKIYIKRDELILDHFGHYFKQIQERLMCDFSYKIIKKVNSIFSDVATEGVTFIIERQKVIDVQTNDTSKVLFGAAIDIGTTTVVMYLHDMIDGSLLGIYSDYNRQISKGADVISRITYCGQHKNGTEELQADIIETINGLIIQASADFSDVASNLYKFVLCGNSTMQHLFHGLNPERLGRLPFISVYNDSIISEGQELNLLGPEQSIVCFLPLIGGFVGADTTSALTTLPRDGKLRLLIDLGTNGEIAVGKNGEYVVSSTACGPALEGAGLEYGMRGIHGAVERFEIENDIPVYWVIGNCKAKGICGSGIIDIIAELIKNRVVDYSGKMMSREVFESQNSHSGLSAQLCDRGGVRAFMVVPPEESLNGEGIFVTQNDIRQIQLAKSAIYTGCMILLGKKDIGGEQIEEIMLAGAFGNYINIKNAEYIQMIPSFSTVNTTSIGNAAGAGAQKYLLGSQGLIESEKITKNAINVELALDPMFPKYYVMNMKFNIHEG